MNMYCFLLFIGCFVTKNLDEIYSMSDDTVPVFDLSPALKAVDKKYERN